MKKLISLTLVLALMAAFCVPALAGSFDASLDIQYPDDDTITVTVQDSEVLEQEQPTLTIPCDFSYAVVTFEDETVPSTLADGKISFRVTKGGTYVITRTDAPSDPEDPDVPGGSIDPEKPASSGGASAAGKPEAEPVSFRDVQASDYYYDAVLWAVANGVTSGTGSGAFSPDRVCTRAQVVTFLWRAAGCPAAEESNPFHDVAADDFFYEAVLWAVANGITTGTGAATFSPDAVVTRAQVVTFLWRAAGCPAAGGTNPFTDVAAEDYCYEAVLWAVKTGVTTGVTKTSFGPDTGCTRAQVVAFLYRNFAE